MFSSGLEKILSLIYAGNCMEKIMDGDAYSRAIRAYTLVRTALSKIILDQVAFDDEERDEIESVIHDVDRSVILVAGNINIIKNDAKKFLEKLGKLKENGPTSQLWVQYFDLTTLLISYIQAERSGDWSLHLETARPMLTIFHAEEYEKYVQKTFFTAKRTDKFLTGV